MATNIFRTTHRYIRLGSKHLKYTTQKKSEFWPHIKLDIRKAAGHLFQLKQFFTLSPHFDRQNHPDPISVGVRYLLYPGKGVGGGVGWEGEGEKGHAWPQYSWKIQT